MTQPIWYDSTEAGAPILNNAAGSLLDVLRACLVSGFNLKSVTSILVASGVATVTCDAHGFSDVYGKLVQISGATEPLLNGNKQIGGVQLNSFTFPAPGVANGAYTGTISAKRAPLGWTEPHTGVNKAIFSRAVPEATGMLLRIDDTATGVASGTDARVLMVETATDVDTYTNSSPSAVRIAGGAGAWIYKGATSAAAKRWALVGDDRFFWLILAATASPSTFSYGACYFGDGVPYESGDPYFCLLNAWSSAANQNTSQGGTLKSTFGAAIDNSVVAARNSDGTLLSDRFAHAGPSSSTAAGQSGAGQISLDRVVIHSPVWVLENTSFLLRGAVPGMAAPLARAPFKNIPQFTVMTVSGSDKKYLNVLNQPAGVQGNFLIDLTGPWY